jgi:hypothetical protein
MNSKLLLKNILKSSKIDHKKLIMKQLSIKDALIYCKVNQLSGQKYGLLLELYLQNKLDASKNNPSDCNGDLSKNGVNYEVKTSLGGISNSTFNFVQIRLNHCCDYLLLAYHLSENNIESLGEAYIFKLTKEEMKKLLVLCGSYAHGTKLKNGKITKESINDTTNTKEYSIRPKFGDKCWNLLMEYRVKEYTY